MEEIWYVFKYIQKCIENLALLQPGIEELQMVEPPCAFHIMALKENAFHGKQCDQFPEQRSSLPSYRHQ